MPVRALPKIDRREMKAKHIDRPAQRREPRGDQGRAVICGKRGFDDAEVSLQRVRVAIGLAGRHRMTRGLGAGELEQGRRKPRIDADQGATIRFVARAAGFRRRNDRPELCSSGVQPTSSMDMDSSPPRGESRSSNGAARSRTGGAAQASASRALTFGLPSRSPPIQDPMRKKEATWTPRAGLRARHKARGIWRRKVVW